MRTIYWWNNKYSTLFRTAAVVLLILPLLLTACTKQRATPETKGQGAAQAPKQEAARQPTQSAGKPQVPPSQSEPKKSDASVPASGGLAPLVSKVLEPSAAAQLVSYQDKVGVIIPGGTLESRQTVTIRPAPNLPAHPSKGFTQLASYDVSMGNVREFKEALTIEIAYDRSMLPNDIPADKALSVAWWDSVHKAWVNAPFAVDTTRNVIMIPTTHLSIWEVVALAKGWSLWETDYFKIYYDKNNTYSIGDIRGPAKDLAVETGIALDRAYIRYRDADYSMRLTFIPSTAVGAFIGALGGGAVGAAAGGYAGGPKGAIAAGRAGLNAGGKIGATIGTAAGAVLVGTKTYVIMEQATEIAEWNKKYTGEIYVPLKHVNRNEFEHDLAHEFFHAVQNGYFSVAESGTVGDWLGTNVHWWNEATADYAPVSVGLSKLDLLPKIPPKYFQAPLPAEDMDGFKERFYVTSRFIAYMVKRGVDFKAMWEAVACLACKERLTAPILKRLEMYHDQRQPNLHALFRSFAAEVFFDSTSPLDLGTGKTLATSGAVSQNTTLSATSTETSCPFTLPADYTALLCRVVVEPGTQAERPLKVEVLGAMPPRDKVTVGVYILPNDQRVPGGVATKLLYEGSQTTNVTVKKNGIVYIMAVNSQTTSQTITVKVSDDAVVLKIAPDKVELRPNVKQEFKATLTGAPAGTKVTWSAPLGGIAFSPPDGLSTTIVSPDRPGTYKVVANATVNGQVLEATATITALQGAFTLIKKDVQTFPAAPYPPDNPKVAFSVSGGTATLNYSGPASSNLQAADKVSCTWTEPPAQITMGQKIKASVKVEGSITMTRAAPPAGSPGGSFDVSASIISLKLEGVRQGETRIINGGGYVPPSEKLTWGDSKSRDFEYVISSPAVNKVVVTCEQNPSIVPGYRGGVGTTVTYTYALR